MARFLLWLSGAKQPVLDQCPSERSKFVGLGGTVLTTAVMAAVSSMFALRMAMHVPLAVCIVAGLAWGVAIMNLDRFLVSSTQRQDSVLKNLVVVLPRVALAVLIGFVIAEPLVLRIFAREITAEQQVITRQRQAKFDADLSADSRYHNLPAQQRRVAELEPIASGAAGTDVSRDPEVARLRDALTNAQAAYADAEHAVIGEKEGSSGSGRAGAGPAYREKVAARDRLAGEVQQLQAQLSAAETAARPRLAAASEQEQRDAANELGALRASVAATEASLRAEQGRFDRASRDNDGLLAQMEALGHLARRQGALAAALWILRLCILAIDALPVLVKFLLTLGAPSLYDRLVALQDEHDEGVLRDRITIERDASRVVANVPLDAAELRRQLELESQERILRRIVEAQERVAAAAVDEWEAQERAHVVVSLSDYIVSTTDDGDAESRAS